MPLSITPYPNCYYFFINNFLIQNFPFFIILPAVLLKYQRATAVSLYKHLKRFSYCVSNALYYWFDSYWSNQCSNLSIRNSVIDYDISCSFQLFFSFNLIAFIRTVIVNILPFYLNTNYLKIYQCTSTPTTYTQIFK